MPTYAYHCDACDVDLELFHSMKEPARTDCPQCHASSLRRVISAGAGLIFKGSGFYQTDYKQTGSKEQSSAAQPESTAKASCGDKSSCACANNSA